MKRAIGFARGVGVGPRAEKLLVVGEAFLLQHHHLGGVAKGVEGVLDVIADGVRDEGVRH